MRIFKTKDVPIACKSHLNFREKREKKKRLFTITSSNLLLRTVSLRNDSMTRGEISIHGMKVYYNKAKRALSPRLKVPWNINNVVKVNVS